MSDSPELDDAGCARIYGLLYWMALCDGELHPREREVLARWAQRLKLGPDQRAALEQEVQEQAPLRLDVAQHELDLLVKGLVEVVAADAWIDREEQARLSTLAELLGLNPAAIREALLREDPGLRLPEL